MNHDEVWTTQLENVMEANCATRWFRRLLSITYKDARTNQTTRKSRDGVDVESSCACVMKSLLARETPRSTT